MPALTAITLLSAWERALPQSPVHRALILLGLCPTTTPECLAGIGLGERDGHLLSLRESVFGPQMSGLVACPGCSQQLELNFTVSSVRAAPPAESFGPCTLRWSEYAVEFRVPNSADIMEITPELDSSVNERRVLECCLLSARRNDEAISLDALPAELCTMVSEQMAEADPQGDVQLPLTCPDCGQRWDAPLDIASYLWAEIHAWATRMLRDVHTLASAYGWREADILMLSPSRRQAYLEMINP